MTRHDRGSRKPLDVKLTPLSDNEWRVSDLREPWDSPYALIGFIGKAGGTYKVLEFGDPMRAVLVSSMDEAVSVFTRSALSIVDKPVEHPVEHPSKPEPPLPPGTFTTTGPVFSFIDL
jgi:hypothetical protein